MDLTKEQVREIDESFAKCNAAALFAVEHIDADSIKKLARTSPLSANAIAEANGLETLEIPEDFQYQDAWCVNSEAAYIKNLYTPLKDGSYEDKQFYALICDYYAVTQ